MANDNQIQMEFVIDDKSVKTQFAKIENQAEKTAPKVQETFSKKGIVDFAAGLFVAEKAFYAFNKAVGAVANTVRKAIDLSIEAEAANIKLGSAFRTLAPAARATEDSFKDFASALQSKIAVDDDFIKSNAAVLVSLGRLSGEGLERATLASFDLAKGIGVNAESAFFLLSKAAAGSTEALSRYGIKIDQSLPKSQKFEAVLKQIEQRFGGLAKADTNTFAGALKVIDLAFEDLLQTFGGFITKSPALISVLKVISDSLVTATSSISGLGANGADLMKPLLIGIFNVGLAVNDYLIKPLELGFNLIRTGVLSIYAAIQGLIAGFVNIADAINKFLFEPIIKGFGFIADKVVGLFNQDLANRIKTNIEAFGATIGGSLGVVADSTTAVFTDAFDSLAASADNTFKSKLGGSLDEFLNKLKTSADNAKAITNDLAASTAVDTASMSESWMKAQAQINTAIQQGIVQSISGGLAKIGENLAKGAGAFDNFANAILGILGDVAIQVGTILIGMGIGIENLKVALATWNGAALVAAGAALVVLGGALKGLAGAPAAGAPAAGGAPGFTGGIGATPVTESEIQPRGQSVTLNISGDVFDTEETGLRIVDILNRSFDQQGVTVRGMA